MGRLFSPLWERYVSGDIIFLKIKIQILNYFEKIKNHEPPNPEFKKAQN